jgi:prepilin-type N-terminal cleavage/methylation domain-containing protein
MRARQGGFTLIELVIALALMGVMVLFMYSGLAFGLRGWDAADTNGRRTADRRIAENFLRREVAELFPMRWKDPMTLRLAFEGQHDVLRFVSVLLRTLKREGRRSEDQINRFVRDLALEGLQCISEPRLAHVGRIREHRIAGGTVKAAHASDSRAWTRRRARWLRDGAF